ncbi:MAG TPA: hypothetical protein VFI47_10520 [Acidimicrobiales bacterium]|nr:hypothetical protein [Acidimicrobiales bacterium]
MIRRWQGVAAVTVVLVLLGTACSDDTELDLPSRPDASGAGDDAQGDDGASPRHGTTFHVAQAVGASLTVRSAPQPNADVALTLSAGDEVSGTVVCLVAQEFGDDWIEVYLPTGAPGSTGWVERDDVTLTRHHFRIEVSLTDRTMSVYSGPDLVTTTPVGIGPDAPPADRHLFIKDLVRPPVPGLYGEYAYGLSGSSNDLDAFTAGSGVVALHGTDDPAVLGTATDRGAIAVDATVMAHLVDTVGLPLGTPVEVVR